MTENMVDQQITNQSDKDALEYHLKPKPGKIEIISSKPCQTEKDLSLAYSPGVAAPCKAIAKNPSLVYDYTSKGNLVAVISDGTAVLGLGNIGPLASKPVMEGKGVLFKQFAGIDVFDIEIKSRSPAEFIQAVQALEPTFGGINLEDIKAPECFEIEEALKKTMNIPVFHDDQHGTAIVSGAGLLNACLITKRDIKNLNVVFNGAGASAMACAKIFISLGVPRNRILMCDSQGVVYKGRKEGMNHYKEEFAVETKTRNLKDALTNADVFVGLSVAGALTTEMIKGMAPNPIIFAMANPDPEIHPHEARRVRPDAIVATGRSDFPNQVNNVLGFPSIFRGALDTRSTQINEAMKLAAVHALANLAREDVPESVSANYNGQSFKFGPDYLIPKPFDTRVLLRVAPAVAKASMESGVATKKIEDWNEYTERLEALQGPGKVFMRSAIHKVHQNIVDMGGKPPRIVFPDGTSERTLKAIKALLDEGICEPILLGYPDAIEDRISALNLPIKDQVQIIQPSRSPDFERYVQELYQRRHRKGVTLSEAKRLMTDTNYFASMMVNLGDADGMVTGTGQNYAEAVRPILRTIGVHRNGVPAGINLVITENRILFLSDTTVNLNPTAEQCAQIALQMARVAEYFGLAPRIAMLSYSNFTGETGTPQKMRLATDLIRKWRPDLMVEGDMQVDTAVNIEIMRRIYPFSNLNDGANILVFPNLESANISYKLLQQIGKVEVIGPFLMGIRRSATVLQRTTTVEGIIHSCILAALEAQFIRKALRQRLPDSLEDPFESMR